jgi:hypothetical protein
MPITTNEGGTKPLPAGTGLPQKNSAIGTPQVVELSSDTWFVGAAALLLVPFQGFW